MWRTKWWVERYGPDLVIMARNGRLVQCHYIPPILIAQSNREFGPLWEIIERMTHNLEAAIQNYPQPVGVTQ